MPTPAWPTLPNPTNGIIIPASHITTLAQGASYLKDRIDNPPRARLTHSTTQSIGNSSVTPLTWDTETEDSAALHSTVTNPSRVTVPSGEDGYWVNEVYIEFASNATGERRVALYLGGSLLFEDRKNAISSSGTRFATTFPEWAVVAGNYFEIYVVQNSGGALNIATAPVWVARRTR